MTRKSQSNVSVSFQYPFYLLRFPLSLRNVSDHFQRRVTITLLSGYFPEALNLTETFEVFTLYVSQPGVSCLCLYNPSMLVGVENRGRMVQRRKGGSQNIHNPGKVQ